MEILHDADVPPPSPTLHTYGETAWSYLVFGAVFVGLAGAALVWLVLAFDQIPLWMGVLIVLGGFLFGLIGKLALNSFQASLAPDSWIMRWSSDGIYLRFRSFHNYRFPSATSTVVYLDRREVAWVRRRSKEIEMPDETGNWSLERKIRGLEIGLRRVDPSPLADALKEEGGRRSANGVRVNHYPVTLSKEGMIRVEMRRAEAVLNKLSCYYPVGPAVEAPLEHFRAMSTAEKEDHILELVQSGRKIDAIKAAREVYGCDLAKAKVLVEGLLEG